MKHLLQPRFRDIHILNEAEKELLTNIGKVGLFFPQNLSDKSAAEQLQCDGWVDITTEGGYVLSTPACSELP